MKISNTQQRLIKIMKERGLRQIDILNLTKPYCESFGVKMNRSDICQYLAGKSEPNQNKLYVLAVALDVAEAWLMGYDVPMKRLTSYSSETLTIKQKQLLTAYDSLNDLGQEEAQKQVENLTYIPKYQKASPLPEQPGTDSEVQEEEDHLMPIAAHSTRADGDASEAVAVARAYLKNRKKQK